MSLHCRRCWENAGGCLARSAAASWPWPGVIVAAALAGLPPRPEPHGARGCALALGLGTLVAPLATLVGVCCSDEDDSCRLAGRLSLIPASSLFSVALFEMGWVAHRGRRLCEHPPINTCAWDWRSVSPERAGAALHARSGRCRGPVRQPQRGRRLTRSCSAGHCSSPTITTTRRRRPHRGPVSAAWASWPASPVAGRGGDLGGGRETGAIMSARSS